MIVGMVIVADGKHEDSIYYTGNPKKYWSANIRMAKFYHNTKDCDNKLRTLKYNNPRKCAVSIKEI